MKKIAKLLMVGLLAISLVLTGVLVACSPDEDPPGPGPIGGGEVEITDGRWSWDGEGFSVSLKLKEDGTFYMSVFMEGNETAGTWEIKDQEKQYYKIVEGSTPAEGDDQTEYTAPQTLVLTAYDGTVYEAAYADNTFWNCNFPGMGSRTLTQDADYEWNPSEDEKNTVEVVRASLPKDANATLILIHDKTFEDAINNESGTWEKTESGYTLKKNDGAAYGTVASSEAGIYTLTLENGESLELYVTAWTPVYTLSKTEVSAKIGGATVEGDAMLRLWEDKSADLIYTVQGDYSVEIYDLVSGTYTENRDGTVTMTFGGTDVTTTAPDAQGNFSATVTVAAGDVLDEDLTVTVTGEAGATVYTGTATMNNAFPSYITVSDVKLLAFANGSFMLSAVGGAGGKTMPITFAQGTFDEEYVFTYTDADNVTKKAEPVLDPESGKLVVTFVKVNADIPLPVSDKFGDVTITLGDSNDFMAAADFVTEKTNIECSDMPQAVAAIEGAYLFMKAGSYEVSIVYGGGTARASVISGKYVIENGNVVFTLPDATKATSANGSVSLSGTANIGMVLNLTFTFTFANKTAVYDADNGDTPFQTDGTNFATITAGTLSMKDGEFTIHFTAKGMTNVAASGTYTDNGDGTFTFACTYTKNTDKSTANYTVSSDADGNVTFAFADYSIMGMFGGGTVSFVFDLIA